MKKFIFIMLALLMCLMPAFALAEGVDVMQEAEFFTWEGLATMGGATIAVLLIVQYVKAPLDKVWKIPTRVLVYVLALAVLLCAEVVMGTITAASAGLAILNAFQVALAAMGAYEVTYKKTEAIAEKPPDNA